MHSYQREFLHFAIASGALRFGQFTLKSGRVSPYFFNAGEFAGGAQLARLGRYYAQAIVANAPPFDLLFGPAYKGIPLAVATAIALADQHGQNYPYAFNRKEAKNHGEGGQIVGSALAGRVLIIDDVITAGTSVRESVALIEAAGATPCGVVIALDRAECGQNSEQSAVAEVQDQFGLPVVSLASIHELIELLDEQSTDAQLLAALMAYRDRFGATI